MSTRTAVLLLVVLFSASAQERTPESAVDTRKSAKPKPHTADSSTSASPWEVHTSIAIEPGKTYSIDSGLDFSSAASAALTLRTSTSSAADLGSLTLQAYWSVPDAEHYNPAESKSGKDFLYSNAGGALFQVYGSQFRLLLRNDSNQVLTIQEVIVFCRSH